MHRFGHVWRNRTKKQDMTLFEQIQDGAKRAGISLAELCRRAGVQYATVNRWKKYPPNNIEWYNALMDEIDKADRANHDEHGGE